MAVWYAYDPSTHILTPAEQVYVLRTVEDGYVKFRFDDTTMTRYRILEVYVGICR